MRKRWKILSMAFVVLFGVLAGRLAYIQLIGGEELASAAASQQIITLEGADSRAPIYDRNGNAIAGDFRQYIYIIEEENVDGETMEALNRVDASEISGKDSGYRVFASDKYSKDAGNRIINNSEGFILEAGRRYRDNQPAAHIVGYVNSADKTGASGLELMYDDQLAGYDKVVSTTADVQGSLLQGKGLTVVTAADNDEMAVTGITTTLDLSLQEKVEEILADAGWDGAVVVIKSDTGEVVASASTPAFNPAEIEEYMESSSGELINKAFQGEYPPGSVFKIVTAAAALEKGVSPDMKFNCSGSCTVNGVTVKCSTGGDEGHGLITLEEAFADSCNCAFIQLAQMTGASTILDTAERLGLGRQVLDGFPGEKEGNLTAVEDGEGAGIANLAIGQGQLLTTPLQIGRMTAIVANDGIDPGIHLVRDPDRIRQPERCITSETARQLQKMMAATMITGTGKDLEAEVMMAAKTGSAEGSQGGTEVIHGWITGFVSALDPEYTVTVFMEDGRSGASSAGPVFAEICSYLSDSKMLQNEQDI